MHYLSVFLIFSLLFNWNPETQSNKKLRYEDWSYEPEIRTVMLYPFTGRGEDMFQSPTVPITQQNLFLEFDDLVEAPEDYQVKLIHCNSDWQPSRLRPLDYLYEYNEFPINEYEFSVDTKISYVHYRFRVPPVKLPGNYLLVAYRANNEKDVILSRRMMVFQNSVLVGLSADRTGVTAISRTNQQLDFLVNYKDFPMQNPLEQISVVIRQNQRWDNTITASRPTYFREMDKILEYRYFAEEEYFYGGNEFRFFDMRSLRAPGQNVAYTDLTTRPSTVILAKDEPRIFEVYSLLRDLNGDFIIANLDTGNGPVESDYVDVVFTLESEQIPGDVYLVGKMNFYHQIPENKMIYDRARGVYQGRQILKQGWYDYQYLVKNDTISPNYIEGDHFETENQYEVFVYFSPMNGRGQLLVGYTSVVLNQRLR